MIKLQERIHKTKTKWKCTRCEAPIENGGKYYAAFIDKHYRYCLVCVGFFLSRYSLTFEIADPSEEVLEHKNNFNTDIYALIYR